MTTDSQARAVPRPRASFTASGGRAAERLPGGLLPTGRSDERPHGWPDEQPDGWPDERPAGRLPAQRTLGTGRTNGRTTGGRALDDAWERLGDGLFTYCLSVLCNQEEAVAAIREVRQLSVRHRRRLRRQDQLRAWLYALARHTCLLMVEGESARGRVPRPSGRHTAEHSRLALLSWPEAAGVTPSQREALELAGRHGLDPAELGAVLDLRTEQAGALLAQAVCELERTAAALAVLAVEACPELARLGAARGAVLGSALRGELVRHVDACPTCRGTAERSAAAGPWPGTFRVPGELRLVEQPEAARRAVGGDGFFAALAGSRRDEPKDLRFDRRGFPVHRTVRAERATMLRQRAVASSVIALVVAAPVVALWAAHQGQGPQEDPVSSVRVDTAPADFSPGSAGPSLGAATGSAQGHHGSGLGPATPERAPAPTARSVSAGPGAPAPVLLTVTADEVAGQTVVTLVNNGATSTAWQAGADADWLRLSRDSGTLGPGERVALLVTVDQASLPEGPWRAQIAFAPSDTVVVLQGPGTGKAAGPGPGSGSGRGSAPGSGGGGGRRGAPPPSASAAPSSAPSAPPSSAPSPPPPTTGSGSGQGPGTPPPSAGPTTAPTGTTPTGTATAAPAPPGSAAPAGPPTTGQQRGRHAR